MRTIVGDNNERSDGDVAGDKLAEERTVLWMVILTFWWMVHVVVAISFVTLKKQLINFIAIQLWDNSLKKMSTCCSFWLNGSVINSSIVSSETNDPSSFSLLHISAIPDNPFLLNKATIWRTDIDFMSLGVFHDKWFRHPQHISWNDLTVLLLVLGDVVCWLVAPLPKVISS